MDQGITYTKHQKLLAPSYVATETQETIPLLPVLCPHQRHRYPRARRKAFRGEGRYYDYDSDSFRFGDPLGRGRPAELEIPFVRLWAVEHRRCGSHHPDHRAAGRCFVT